MIPEETPPQALILFVIVTFVLFTTFESSYELSYFTFSELHPFPFSETDALSSALPIMASVGISSIFMFTFTFSLSKFTVFMFLFEW